MTIDCAAVLHFSVADRAAAIIPSCPYASRDIDAMIGTAFVNHGSRWARILCGTLIRKHYRERRRFERAHK